MNDLRIPNDDLGEWGESQFRALCSAASLVASKAERDKMGWDFIVELPPNPATGAMFPDQRPNGLGCRVQIKTRWRRKSDRLKLNLAAAERLAKDPGASFILVLTAEASTTDQQPQLVGCHLIHMLDGNLERVLRRLRQSATGAQVKSTRDQTISFSPKIAGEQLPQTGKAIRDAFLRICGVNAQAYIAKKGGQLKDLGYTAGRYQLNTTITANNYDEFVEMMLGLRPLSIERLKTYDVRFGLNAPVDHIPPGATYEMKLELKPQLKCTIRVRGAGLTPPAIFLGEVFIPVVPIPIEHMRMLIKAPFFTLDLLAAGKTNLTVHGQELMDASLTLEDWQHYFRLFQILGEEEVEFDIEGNEPRIPRTTSKLKPLKPLIQDSEFFSLSHVARRGEALLKLAGGLDKSVTLAEIESAANLIDLAYFRLFEPNTVPSQTFQTDAQLPDGIAIADLEFLQADIVVFPDITLAYACRVIMHPERAGTGLLWRQVDSKPEKLTVIENTVDAFKTFVADVRTRTGIQNMIIRNLKEDRDCHSGAPS